MISKILIFLSLFFASAAFGQDMIRLPDGTLAPRSTVTIQDDKLPRVNLLIYTSVANLTIEQYSIIQNRGFPELFVKVGKDYRKVNLSAGSVSAPVEYVGESPIVLTAEVKTQEGVTRVPVATIPFSKEDETILAILSSQSNGFGVNVIPFGAKALPEGNIFLLNMSSRSVAYQIASSQGILTAGKTQLVSLNNLIDYRLPIQIFHAEENEWKGVFSGLNIARGNERLLYIVVQSADPNLGWSLYTTKLPALKNTNTDSKSK